MNKKYSPKRVVFDLDSAEISNISIGKMITKCVANHSSKAYEFSHFLTYSDLVQSLHPFKREGKLILPKPFTHDDVSIDVLDLEFKEEDQVESDLGIEDEVQIDPDPNPDPTPNPRTKWAQKVIEVARNMAEDSYEKRRTRSQFQDESLALCHANLLLPERCYKFPERCYTMVRFDQQFCKVGFHDSPKQGAIDKEYE